MHHETLNIPAEQVQLDDVYMSGPKVSDVYGVIYEDRDHKYVRLQFSSGYRLFPKGETVTVDRPVA